MAGNASQYDKPPPPQYRQLAVLKFWTGMRSVWTSVESGCRMGIWHVRLGGLLTLLLALGGCDGMGTGGPDPLATTILDAYADPNPVAVGDTTLLRVVIKDSTDSGFRYRWSWSRSVPSVYTVVPELEWVVDVDPGQYSVGVEVSRAGFTSTGTRIDVTVTQ